MEMNKEDKEVKDALELAKKLRALHRSTLKHGAILGVKTAALLFLANACIILIDAFLIHSDASQMFCFFGGLLNAFFIFRMTGREMRKERDRVSEEVKKILQNH